MGTYSMILNASSPQPSKQNPHPMQKRGTTEAVPFLMDIASVGQSPIQALHPVHRSLSTMALAVMPLTQSNLEILFDFGFYYFLWNCSYNGIHMMSIFYEQHSWNAHYPESGGNLPVLIGI